MAVTIDISQRDACADVASSNEENIRESVKSPVTVAVKNVDTARIRGNGDIRAAGFI